MQYYFDRTAPLFLTQNPGYDAVPVAVNPDFAQFVLELEGAVEKVKDNFNNFGAPEDSAQELAELFHSYVMDSFLIRSMVDEINTLDQALQEVEDEEDD
jgi:hypothetical protein